MKVSLPVNTIFKPSNLSMLAVAASFVAWIFPSFDVLQKGFDSASRMDLNSCVILALWYLLIFLSFTAGQQLGSLPILGKARPIDKLIDLDHGERVYYAFTLLSTLGIFAMLAEIFRTMSLQEAFLRISLGQVNALKEALYEDYSIGLPSLRYLILYSASFAAYRIIRLKQYRLLNLFNLFMLALSAFLSFRLILIAALVATSFLLSRGKRAVKLSVSKIALATSLLFLILSALNISRNAGYYEQNHLSFWLAGFNEIDAYLGTPFQAAMGSANHLDQLAAAGLGNGTLGGEPYRQYVDLGVNYMTNSAFVYLPQQMGFFAWPYICALCFTMGLVFELLASWGRTVFLLPCGAILYASAELWRINLYAQGTFIVWFVIGIGLPASLLFARQLSRFLGRIYRVPGGPDVHPPMAPLESVRHNLP
jgi:hypothetical protein